MTAKNNELISEEQKKGYMDGYTDGYHEGDLNSYTLVGINKDRMQKLIEEIEYLVEDSNASTYQINKILDKLNKLQVKITLNK
jgi:flagellar biosynthesis/type III secretory pathway protein FliH